MKISYNIHLYSNYIQPSERNGSDEVMINSAYIFSRCLKSFYFQNTIHNFKSPKKRSMICSKLKISERNYYRFLKSALENGFVSINPENKKILRIVGDEKIIKGFVTEEKELLYFPYWKKVSLNFKNLLFKDFKDVLTLASIKYLRQNKRLFAAKSRKKHIKLKNQKKELYLNYLQQGSTNIALQFEELNSALRHHVGLPIENEIRKLIWNDNSSANSTRPNIRNQEIESYWISNEKINKIKNSGIISACDYYSTIFLKELYNDELSSGYIAKNVGYKKSGVNSLFDRMQDRGFIIRNHRYVHLASIPFKKYESFRKGGMYSHLFEEDGNDLARRVIYRHGCVLLQRENDIVFDDSIKFMWEEERTIGLVGKDPIGYISPRYSAIASKLKMRGYKTTKELLELKKLSENILEGLDIKENEYTSGLIISTNGDKKTLVGKINKVPNPQNISNKDLKKKLMGGGYVSNGDTYHYLNRYCKNNNLNLKQNESRNYPGILDSAA